MRNSPSLKGIGTTLERTRKFLAKNFAEFQPRGSSNLDSDEVLNLVDVRA